MIGSAENHDRSPLGQCHDQAGRPRHAVRMNNDGMNIVEHDPALFLPIKRDDVTP